MVRLSARGFCTFVELGQSYVNRRGTLAHYSPRCHRAFTSYVCHHGTVVRLSPRDTRERTAPGQSHASFSQRFRMLIAAGQSYANPPVTIVRLSPRDWRTLLFAARSSPRDSRAYRCGAIVRASPPDTRIWMAPAKLYFFTAGPS